MLFIFPSKLFFQMEVVEEEMHAFTPNDNCCQTTNCEFLLCIESPESVITMFSLSSLLKALMLPKDKSEIFILLLIIDLTIY